MKYILFILSIFLSIIVLFNSVSRFIQPLDRKMAFELNPFNDQARRFYIKSQLSPDLKKEDIPALKKIIQTGMKLDPYDARFYSFLGLLEEGQGNKTIAQDYYIHSLKLIQTEQYALLRRFVYFLEQGENLEAAKIVELIYLRWKPNWPLVQPFLPIIYADENAYESSKRFFGKLPDANNFIGVRLGQDPATQDLAIRFLTDWHKDGKLGLEHLIGRVSGWLIDAGRYKDAYNLFFLTVLEEKQKSLGYIFNSSFDFEPIRSPFDWSFRKQSGVSIRLKKTSRKFSDDKSLELRFLNKPINFQNIAQKIRLPPSNFQLKVSYVNQDLKGPKPLKVGVFCHRPRRLLGEVELSASQAEDQDVTLKFEVPKDNCNLQEISVYNKNFSKAWSNRYTGRILLHDITIEFLGG